MEKRISEGELIEPALNEIVKAGNKGLKTTKLIKILRKILKPTGEDLKILAGRKDDKFSQKVRNLIAHRTLKPYAIYDENTKRSYITDLYFQRELVVNSNLQEKEKDKLKDFIRKGNSFYIPETLPEIIIEEGKLFEYVSKLRTRSKKLIKLNVLYVDLILKKFMEILAKIILKYIT